MMWIGTKSSRVLVGGLQLVRIWMDLLQLVT